MMLKNMLMLACAVLLMGCEHADPLDEGTPDPTATLASIQQNIFNTSCALSGCHAGANPQQGMNLSEGQAHGSIVGVSSRERPNLLRVDPGDPDNSYLVKKIQGDSDIVGGRMPLGRAALSADQINLIRTWITEGAQDN